MKRLFRTLMAAWISAVSFGCLAAPASAYDAPVRVLRDTASGHVLSVTVQDRTFYFDYRDGAFAGATDSQGNAYTEADMRARVDELTSKAATLNNPRYLAYQNRFRLREAVPGVLSSRFWLYSPQQKDFLADNSCAQQCNDIYEANMLICAAIGVVDPPLGLACMAGAYIGRAMCTRGCGTSDIGWNIGWYNDWGDFMRPSVPDDEDWQFLP